VEQGDRRVGEVLVEDLLDALCLVLPLHGGTPV
jgi:hypothetical protein